MGCIRKICVIVGLLLVSACAPNWPFPEVPEYIPIRVTDADRPKILELRHVRRNILPLSPYYIKRRGLYCSHEYEVKSWAGGQYDREDILYKSIFKDVTEKAGYTSYIREDNPFAKRHITSNTVQLSAIIRERRTDICQPLKDNDYYDFSDEQSYRGKAYTRVEWQLYDTKQKKLLGTWETEGVFLLELAEPDGNNIIWQKAFAAATRNLLANKDFHSFVTGH